jgi:cell division septation protein DedD
MRCTILFALLCGLAVPAAAQDATLPTTPQLLAIVRLAQDGHGDSARTAVDDLLERTVPGDPLYAEALYTAATVAKSGEAARLLFSRVVVEHGSSPWADRALLRLTQLDFGTGDTEAAVMRVRRLMNDYPTSPMLPAAALWGSRAAFERRDQAQACEWLRRGIEQVGNDVEIRSQLEFAVQRCGIPMAPETSPAAERVVPSGRDMAPPPAVATAAPERTPDPAPVVRSATAGAWRVQVAAIRDAAAIRRVEQQITRAGLTVFKVPGPGGLTKMQAGPFATRDDAVAKVATLKAAVGGEPFVVKVE